jgi:hypothetical protein
MPEVRLDVLIQKRVAELREDRRRAAGDEDLRRRNRAQHEKDEKQKKERGEGVQGVRNISLMLNLRPAEAVEAGVRRNR